jgi:hypothetical protein
VTSQRPSPLTVRLSASDSPMDGCQVMKMRAALDMSSTLRLHDASQPTRTPGMRKDLDRPLNMQHSAPGQGVWSGLCRLRLQVSAQLDHLDDLVGAMTHQQREVRRRDSQRPTHENKAVENEIARHQGINSRQWIFVALHVCYSGHGNGPVRQGPNRTHELDPRVRLEITATGLRCLSAGICSVTPSRLKERAS